MRYLDTSLLVAALTREPRTGAMQAWLASQPADTLCISEWVYGDGGDRGRAGPGFRVLRKHHVLVNLRQ